MPLEIVIGFDRDASCSGRDCLRRIEREDAGIPECARLHAVPLGSDRMGAILDERDLIGPAIFGDTVNIECDVPADVYDVSERRLMQLSLLAEVRVRSAQAFAIEIGSASCRARVSQYVLVHV